MQSAKKATSNKAAMQARVEALDTEIARILTMPPAHREEMGFDWHLQCLQQERKALSAVGQKAVASQLEYGTKVIDADGNTWEVVGICGEAVELSRQREVNGKKADGRFTFTANYEMLVDWIKEGQCFPELRMKDGWL